MPVLRWDIKSWLKDKRGETTLLGICPMSEEIIEACLKEAAESRFIPMFVATPRQVDADRGYTGWSQEGLTDLIHAKAVESDYNGQYLVARDHGGPYQSMRDRGRPEVNVEDAMFYAEEMFTRDLKSGFDVLHVDATEDPRNLLTLDDTVKRTARLIDYIEEVRMKENHQDVFYEVGSEEISHGITEPEGFERFIHLLKRKLYDRGCEGAIDRLLFIVGDVGTDMRIDMTNQFNPERAKILADIALKHDLFLKVHYTDWLEDRLLEQFPKLGIGAANVGPEFAAATVESLVHLEKEERRSVQERGETSYSKLTETLEELAVKHAPWRRFVPKDLDDKELLEYSRQKRREIARCVGRYVMKNQVMVEARLKLYKNLKEFSSLKDPHKFVIGQTQKAIHRYVKAFNLESLQ